MTEAFVTAFVPDIRYEQLPMIERAGGKTTSRGENSTSRDENSTSFARDLTPWRQYLAG
jgi:hypothetical protein